VLYVLWPEPLIVPGRDAIVTELIRLAGGESVTAHEPSDYPRFSLEAAVARAPEVILLARHGTGSAPLARAKWDALGQLPAVRAGRVHAVDGNLLHRHGGRLLLVLASLSAALVVVAAVALLVGSVRIAPGTVVQVLAGRVGPESTEAVVILSLRLPRIVAAAVAGGALAVAGVGFQALTRNPLAEPSVLGVSGGAAFGVVIGQLVATGGGIVVDAIRLTLFGFAGALLAGVAVYLVASVGGGLPVQTLLLAGVIVGIFFASATTVLTSLVDINRLGGIVHWLLGNISPIPPAPLGVFAALAGLGFGLIVGRARQLNLLALGEEAALQLGVDAERLKLRIFVGSALLTASVVAFAGPIGFVGLVVPHALRLVLGPDNRVLAPAALVAGGAFLLAADTLARNVVAPTELSVGVITSFCGAPVFVYLLRTRPRGGL
jgi:iron complex transport system permease protein